LVSTTQGSVLIFANLDEHGDGIKSTLHGGCPVFLGSKWIANKWVQLNGQDVNFRAIKPSAWTDVLSS
jgi:prolyl 4-hydroxylase